MGLLKRVKCLFKPKSTKKQPEPVLSTTEALNLLPPERETRPQDAMSLRSFGSSLNISRDIANPERNTLPRSIVTKRSIRLLNDNPDAPEQSHVYPQVVQLATPAAIGSTLSLVGRVIVHPPEPSSHPHPNPVTSETASSDSKSTPSRSLWNDITPARIAALQQDSAVTPLLRIYRSNGTIRSFEFENSPGKASQTSNHRKTKSNSALRAMPSWTSLGTGPETPILSESIRMGLESSSAQSSTPENHQYSATLETASRLVFVQAAPVSQPPIRAASPINTRPRPTSAISSKSLPSPPPSPDRRASVKSPLRPSSSNSRHRTPKRPQTAPQMFGRPKSLLRRCVAQNTGTNSSSARSSLSLAESPLSGVDNRLRDLSRQMDELQGIIDSTRITEGHIDALAQRRSPSLDSLSDIETPSPNRSAVDATNSHEIENTSNDLGSIAMDSLELIRSPMIEKILPTPDRSFTDDYKHPLTSTPPLRIKAKHTAGLKRVSSSSRIPRLTKSRVTSNSSMYTEESLALSTSTFGRKKHRGIDIPVPTQHFNYTDLSAELTQPTKEMMAAARASIGRRRNHSRTWEQPKPALSKHHRD